MDWNYHFVIAKIEQQHSDEDIAVNQAISDLDAAFSQRAKTGTDNTVGEYLRSQGYVSVNDFKVIDG